MMRREEEAEARMQMRRSLSCGGPGAEDCVRAQRDANASRRLFC